MSGNASRPTPLSAGILLYRIDADGPRVLLGHPGGPYHGKKDAGAWSIPKGLVNDGESVEAAARREFEEELGWQPDGLLEPLGDVRLRWGKRVVGFALRTGESEDALLHRFKPGECMIEWPPRSGRRLAFPEIDRIAFFSLDEARIRLNPAQAAFLDRLERLLIRRR